MTFELAGHTFARYRRDPVIVQSSLALSIAERETEQFPRLFAAGHVLFSAAVWFSPSLAASLSSCPVCECMLLLPTRSIALSLSLSASSLANFWCIFLGRLFAAAHVLFSAEASLAV